MTTAATNTATPVVSGTTPSGLFQLQLQPIR